MEFDFSVQSDEVGNNLHSSLGIDFSQTTYDFTEGVLPQTPQMRKNETITKAELWVFAPKKHLPHMVRPYVYNFSDNNALAVMHQAFNSNRNLTDKMAIESAPELLDTIRPASYGQEVNLASLNDNWTFMLTTEARGVTGLLSYMSCPIYKTVSLGYCSEDPIGFNGAINPNCYLRFTHHSKHQVTPNAMNPALTNSIPKQSHDVIPIEYKNMALMTQGGQAIPNVKLLPQDLRPIDDVALSYAVNGGNIMPAMQGLIKPVLNPNDPTYVSSDYRYSPFHLRRITDTITQAGKALNETSLFGYDSSYRPSSTDLTTTFFDLMNANEFSFNNGIGSWDIRRLADIDAFDLPNLQIRKIDVLQPRSWEVVPSNGVNQRNTYNSWIADSVAQACEMEGITQLAFSYDSCCGNIYEKEGRWQIQEKLFNTIHGANAALVKKAFFNIKGMLENNLFFLMKHTIGDFVLSVHYCMTSATIVDLFLKDYHDNTPGAYYEQPQQFGGLINSNIGNSEQYLKNCLNVHNLLSVLET